MKLSMQNKTSHHLEDNDEFYFDNDILNDKVHLFFKSNRNSVDEYTIRGHQFLNSFELSINTLGVEHDTCLLYTSPSPRDIPLSRMPSSA